MSDGSTLKTSLILSVLILLSFIAGAFWLDRQHDRHQNDMRNTHWVYSVEPATVEGWMTFNYLNETFALPTSYLQDTLQIEDPRYPYISITQYTKNRNLNAEDFLGRVRTTLHTYMATSTP